MVALISRTPQARVIAPSVSDAGGNWRRRAKQKGRWRTVTASCANAAGREKEIGIGLVQLLFAQRTLARAARPISMTRCFTLRMRSRSLHPTSPHHRGRDQHSLSAILVNFFMTLGQHAHPVAQQIAISGMSWIRLSPPSDSTPHLPMVIVSVGHPGQAANFSSPALTPIGLSMMT